MKKSLFIIGMIALLGLLAGCNLQTIGAEAYYVKITADGEEYEEQDNVRYEYNLTGYDEEASSMDLSFTTNHLLKHDAYLRVFYKKEKVITYEEVQAEDIPKQAFTQIENEK